MSGADRRWETSRLPLIASCVMVKLLILLVAGSKYGYLSDELYFLDASERLAFGYVDAPPGIMWLLAFITPLIGDSVWVLRAVAALIGVIVVLVAVDVCRLLGGHGFAQWLTAIVVSTAPAFVSIQAILTMNVLDQLWWALSFRLLLRYIDAGQPRHMLLLGLVFGLGMLTKLSILVLGLSFAVSLLLWRRDLYRRPEIWWAAALALTVTLPYLIWQVANGWPLLEFMTAYNCASPEPMVFTASKSHASNRLSWFLSKSSALRTAERAASIATSVAALTCVLMSVSSSIPVVITKSGSYVAVAASANSQPCSESSPPCFIAKPPRTCPFTAPESKSSARAPPCPMPRLMTLQQRTGMISHLHPQTRVYGRRLARFGPVSD